MMGSVTMLTVFLVALLIYMMWMDLAFYLEIQNLLPRSMTTSIPEEAKEHFSFSVFHPITAKLMMLTPTIQFIEEPLSYLIVRCSNLAAIISPNAMSLLDVVVAMFSAKFIMSDSLKCRQFGVILFKVRDLIDALDGNIARERSSSHSVGQVANPDSWGWYVNGCCDGFGDILRFVAIGFHLQRVWSSSHLPGGGYSLLETKSGVPSGLRGRVYRQWIAYKRPITIMFLVGLQSLLSSVLWNYFMIEYHTVLETNYLAGGNSHSYLAVAMAQNMVIKSSSMWIVCYFWRLISPVGMGQLQLIAIMYNFEEKLVIAIQLLGFLPPLILGIVTSLHLEYATSIVSVAAMAASTTMESMVMMA